jgi:colanic acid/amylovoran biosynthesis glycosyltransferase
LFSGLSTNLIRLEKYWPLYKNWLYRQLKNAPPDVLHAHFGSLGCQYLDLAKRLNIPLVVSFYGYDFQRLTFENPGYQRKYQQLFQQAHCITTTGPFTPGLLVAQGCPSEKIVPMPLSMDPQQFPWQLRSKMPGQLRLLQVATITRKKGHLDTLQALVLLLKKCPNVSLTLAGEQQDKKLAAEMRDLIKRHQLADHVTWLPAIPHEDLAGFMATNDVFIHPSCQPRNHDSEGAPVVILEAQSTGLPVVATRHADIPAEVIHGATGLLSSENDPVALAQSLERFYWMEDVEYQQFSRQASNHVATNFDVQVNAGKFLALYQSLL